ncbi:uncharacterized protein LOC122277010 [Carya illinoinensis]|uniref:uncharacterized protein LOC122277010 n=1 Tax=Carya illinoinensis TaxID=32201 RepID=UPI001C71A08E|nr:uncharacterized protein LOC122277010 [Carya illinoinensis]
MQTLVIEEEDLSKRWERLHLSQEESKVFHVSAEGKSGNSTRWKYFIIGGILVDKGISHEAFRVTMSQVWKLDGWVQFKDLGNHKFLIEFKHLADKDRVLGGRPWFFDRNLLSLQEVDERMPMNSVNFNFEPFWVQLHGVPLAAMTVEVGTQLGAAIGEVIRVDADSNG